jgi:hypothetical protein
MYVLFPLPTGGGKGEGVKILCYFLPIFLSAKFFLKIQVLNISDIIAPGPRSKRALCGMRFLLCIKIEIEIFL